MDSHHHNPQFFFDSLYCEEEQSDAGEELLIMHNTVTCSIKCQGDSSNSDVYEELSYLLDKEQGNELYQNPYLAEERADAVEWMLKVIGYYSFSSLTAVLAVNYLDRFLHSFHSHREKPWMTHLAAVACLSLAAKVEEIQVPLLLDLQVEDSKYVFESKTIQRMEILILSTLEWKMNPVTPFPFLDYIAKRLGLKDSLCTEFLRRCDCLLLSLISDCRFMCHMPSAMATAVMLYVINSLEPFNGVECRDQLVSILGINKDKVEECCGLIQEVATSIHFFSCNKRKFGSIIIPGSPKGVVDVSFSSDSSYDSSWCLHTTPIASVSSSPEPLSKKIKSQSPNNAFPF